MRGLLLGFGLAAAVLATRPAQAGEQLDLGPHERRCDGAVARKVPLDRVLADPNAYRGECVSVVGYWASRAAFTEPMAPPRRYSNASADVARFRIGLYLPDDALPPPEPIRARIVGVVSDCSCLHEAETLLVLGYCHYTGGPFLDVRYIRALE